MSPRVPGKKQLNRETSAFELSYRPPAYWSNEDLDSGQAPWVEVACRSMASGSGDYAWIMATPGTSGGIDYSVMDELETTYHLPFTHSELPLTLDEMFRLIDETVDDASGHPSWRGLLTGPVAFNLEEGCDAEMESFITIQSNFYPELAGLCDAYIERYIKRWRRNDRKRRRYHQRKLEREQDRARSISLDHYPIGSDARLQMIEMRLSSAMRQERPEIGLPLAALVAEWSELIDRMSMSGETAALHVRFLRWALEGRVAPFADWALENLSAESERSLMGLRKVYNFSWPSGSMVSSIFQAMWGWLQLELYKPGITALGSRSPQTEQHLLALSPNIQRWLFD